jgi:hypothetical protein
MAEENTHVFDEGWHSGARSEHAHARTPARPRPPRDHARATAIKPAPVLGYLPRCILCTAPNSSELARSSGDLSAARQSRPRATTVAEPFPASSARSKPLDRSPRRPWSLPELEPRTPANGKAQSCSPEFGTAPAHVDRVSLCTIFRFTARIASTSPHETPRAIGLIGSVVVRPEHSPPTSSPACARGPADSGHPRRRAVPCCDRQDLPEPTPPLARPLSPSVSRAAFFTPAGTI